MKDSLATPLCAAPALSRGGALCFALFVIAILQSTPAIANDAYDPGIHGVVTIATDNRFRSLSLTQGDPALVAEFDVVTNKYFYAGAATSNIGNVNLNSLLRQVKLSIYGGGKGAIVKNLYFDFRFSRNINYDLSNERKLPGGYDEFSFSIESRGLKAGIAYSDNFQHGTGRYLYPYVGADFGLFGFLNLNLHGGYNKYMDSDTLFDPNNTAPIRPGIPDYFDWRAGVTLNIFSSTKVSISLVGSDIHDDYCGPLEACNPKIVVSLTKVL